MLANKYIFYSLFITLLINIFVPLDIYTNETEERIITDSIHNRETVTIDPKQNEQDIDSFEPYLSIKSTKDDMVNDNNLKIDPENDIYWEVVEGGNAIDLFIRKKDKIRSVMLTNMYQGKKFIEEYGNKVYGLQVKDFNSINGKEKRVFQDKLVSNTGTYFLVDSSVEKNYVFGQAFRIRVPYRLEYGYRMMGENYGVIFLKEGTVLNLRTYERPYADAKGHLKNNAIRIDFSKDKQSDSMRPKLNRVNVLFSNGFTIIRIKYFSLFDYIKYVLIRDIHYNNMFQRISFSNEPYQDKTAVVLRAMNKPNEGISMVMDIYLKGNSFEKDYDISVVDQQNRLASYLSYTIRPINPKKQESSINNQFNLDERQILNANKP